MGYAYTSGQGWDGLAASRSADSTSSITQAVASVGEITVSASGTGEIVPVSEVSLGFQQAGELAELNVQPGDWVKAGDVLARLQVDRSQAKLAATFAAAQYDLVVAQQALDDLYASADHAAAQALVALEQAEDNLASVQDNAIALAQQALAQAEQAVQDAQEQLAILNARPSQAVKDVALSAMLFKEKDLQALDEQIARLTNQVKTAPIQMKDRLRQQLAQLKIRSIEQKAELDKRQAAYQDMGASADPDELALPRRPWSPLWRSSPWRRRITPLPPPDPPPASWLKPRLA